MRRLLYLATACLAFHTTAFAQTIPTINTDPAIGSRCLDVPNGNYTAGTRVVTYVCQRSPNQSFEYVSSNRSIRVGNFCLDAFRPGGGASQPGDAVGIWPCQGSPNQVWEKRQTPYGKTMLINMGDGRGALCLDVANGLNQNGALLVVWPCQQSPNQFFEVHSVYRLLTPR